jgi:hypothetical protein
MKNPNENPGSPRAWPDEVKVICGERPAFTGGPMPAAGPPPLEGERRCVCGQPEGVHRIDGACDASGCDWFVAEGAGELRLEYDEGAV